MVDIHQEGRSQRSAPQRRHRHTWDNAPAAHPGNLVTGTEEVIRRPAPPGEIELAKHLVTWATRTWEGHKTQAQPSLCLWGLPECLDLSGLNLGGACSPGAASDGSRWSNLEPEQCGQGGYTRHEPGQTQCGWGTASTCQCYLFAASLPPHSATEQVSLKKVSTTAPFVSGWKSNIEETSKQKLKQRETPWKWQEQ